MTIGETIDKIFEEAIDAQDDTLWYSEHETLKDRIVRAIEDYCVRYNDED